MSEMLWLLYNTCCQIDMTDKLASTRTKTLNDQ